MAIVFVLGALAIQEALAQSPQSRIAHVCVGALALATALVMLYYRYCTVNCIGSMCGQITVYCTREARLLLTTHLVPSLVQCASRLPDSIRAAVSRSAHDHCLSSYSFAIFCLSLNLTKANDNKQTATNDNNQTDVESKRLLDPETDPLSDYDEDDAFDYDDDDDYLSAGGSGSGSHVSSSGEQRRAKNDQKGGDGKHSAEINPETIL